MAAKTLKKIAPEMKYKNMVEITISVPLPKGGRRVTMADVRQASAAGAAAVRASLESHRPAYVIDGDVETETRYSLVYEQTRRPF